MIKLEQNAQRRQTNVMGEHRLKFDSVVNKQFNTNYFTINTHVGCCFFFFLTVNDNLTISKMFGVQNMSVTIRIGNKVLTSTKM